MASEGSPQKRMRMERPEGDGAMEIKGEEERAGFAGEGGSHDSDHYDDDMTPWKEWSVEDVAHRLLLHGIPGDAVQKFRENRIEGKHLRDLTDSHIRDTLKIQELGTQMNIRKFLESLERPDDSKVFNDPIHGHMEFPPLCMAIIDTPQFQRLRYLKQLGACYFVYPGASHNRFEHCLGVCFLAGQLVTALRRRQPELCITERDVLCVQIAGLCHDLGHGPFSHLFDGQFIPHTRPDIEEWKKTFYYGPDSKKSFLYEIVANKRNGVDVDKWDYFRRDCHHLGISSSFDHMRFIHFSRVIRVDNELQICVRDKEVFNMYEMFHTRHALHRRAYQHKVVQAVEIMLVEAMEEADDYILTPGKNGEMKKISQCIDDMSAYTNLTDTVFNRILVSNDPRLARAQSILHDIQKRKLYKCVGETEPIKDDAIMKKKVDTIKTEILAKLTDKEKEELQLDASSFVVQKVKLDFGKKEDNPVNDLRFFSKSDKNTAEAVMASEVSHLVPQTQFREQLVRLFLRPTEDRQKNEKRLEALFDAFTRWCQANKINKAKKMTPCTPHKCTKDSHVTPDRPISMEKARSETKARKEISFR
ncbi:deoxynucleoside triphosphate triphosphohydrolase SAMHD1-like isoform X2 [Babylonia areolata]|uniref:deoxynucleoside triphosphate triphosphohydrolase SAMHD1-like isoform X2 n=1 Tax=Babylonia areolata TaxID=304850 RepID=UPI003FD3750B